MAEGSYKAVRYEILGQDRYLVIPHGKEAFELCDPRSRTLPDDVVCQASTWPNAVMIATALNYAKYAGKIEPSK